MATRPPQPRAVAVAVAQPERPELRPFAGVIGDPNARTIQAPVRKDVDYDAPMNPIPLFIYLALVFLITNVAFVYGIVY